MSGRSVPPSDAVLACSTKSQCSVMPANSTTRRRPISPYLPRMLLLFRALIRFWVPLSRACALFCMPSNMVWILLYAPSLFISRSLIFVSILSRLVFNGSMSLSIAFSLPSSIPLASVTFSLSLDSARVTNAWLFLCRHLPPANRTRLSWPFRNWPNESLPTARTIGNRQRKQL
jgi:hypothetical protein